MPYWMQVDWFDGTVSLYASLLGTLPLGLTDLCMGGLTQEHMYDKARLHGLARLHSAARFATIRVAPLPCGLDAGEHCHLQGVQLHVGF